MNSVRSSHEQAPKNQEKVRSHNKSHNIPPQTTNPSSYLQHFHNTDDNRFSNGQDSVGFTSDNPSAQVIHTSNNPNHYFDVNNSRKVQNGKDPAKNRTLQNS